MYYRFACMAPQRTGCRHCRVARVPAGQQSSSPPSRCETLQHRQRYVRHTPRSHVLSSGRSCPCWLQRHRDGAFELDTLSFELVVALLASVSVLVAPATRRRGVVVVGGVATSRRRRSVARIRHGLLSKKNVGTTVPNQPIVPIR